jgi:hypothetical protein
LHGALDLLLFLPCDVGANRFGHALNGLRRDLQACQQFHLLPAMIKGSVLPDQRLHASHAGGEIAAHDVEFLVGWKLPFMTVPTQIVRPHDFHRANRRQHRFRAQLMIERLLPAGAWNGTLVGFRNWEAQQLAQGAGTRLMHSRAHQHLDGFQLQTACFA